MDDIARKLGITKGTVSKALSGAADVSEIMRRQVLETAVELGYSRIPRAEKAPKICVFIENMEYTHPEDFGWGLVTGFRKQAEPNGYRVSLVPLTRKLEEQIHYDEYMLLHNYVGAFFLGITLLDPWMKDLKSSRTPAVLLDNPAQFNPSVSQVGIDNDEGMEMAVSQLVKLGHKTIGYLGGDLDSNIYLERYQAFFRALEKHAMPASPELAGHSFHLTDCTHKFLPRLLKQGCTAIICSHDQLAQAVLHRCAEKKIRVPEDVSIIGIDDLPLCLTTVPQLSTIRQDRNELGKSAFYALSCQMSKVRINTLKLHPELIVRGSIGPEPKADRKTGN